MTMMKISVNAVGVSSRSIELDVAHVDVNELVSIWDDYKKYIFGIAGLEIPAKVERAEHVDKVALRSYTDRELVSRYGYSNNETVRSLALRLEVALNELDNLASRRQQVGL